MSYLNNSVKYIKRLVKEYPDRVSDDIKILDLDKINEINLMTYIENNIKSLKVKENKVDVQLLNEEANKFVNVNLKHNPNAEFNYFTTDISTHDGTLLFMGQAIERILSKILTAQTQYREVIPKGFNENDFFEYDYFYEVGDILVHSDVGMKNINGRNIMGQRDIMMLPIKFNMVRKKD